MPGAFRNVVPCLTNEVESKKNWLARVLENFREALTAPKLMRVSAANGAPVHLLEVPKTGKERRAQVSSFAAHILGIALILWFTATAQGPFSRVQKNGTPQERTPLLTPYFHESKEGSGGKQGQGGGNEQLPATKGNFATPSPIQLISPRVPDDVAHILAVPPTIQDEESSIPKVVETNLGIVNAKEVNGSNGSGPGHSIGDKGGEWLGNDEGTRGTGGSNKEGPYGSAVTDVRCAYCPEPTYTEEARKEKLQGNVTLRVLVGADGKAHAIQVVKSLGMGLDEKAMETVRGWKFVPSQNAEREPVAKWVIVEAVYRLF